MLDDAVIRQDTIDMLVAQIRRVRKLIPELEGVPVRDYNLVGPGRPPCDWMPTGADVDRLISELVDDANELVWAGEDLVEAGLELTDKQAQARWPRWHWWPARTSSPAMSRAGGGSRSAPRRIGSSPPSTPSPGMRIRPPTTIGTASKLMCRWSPRPAGRSSTIWVRATPPTPRLLRA